MSRAPSLRADAPAPSPDSRSLVRLCRIVREGLREQVAAWRERSFFERHWIAREFRQRAGLSIEEWITALERLERALHEGRAPAARPPLARLSDFYTHLAQLAAGYLRDADEREAQLAKIGVWKTEVERLASGLEALPHAP